MYRPGRAIEVERELIKHGVEIAALQEIRWPGTGVQELEDGYILYSGRKDERHEKGVGFYVR